MSDHPYVPLPTGTTLGKSFEYGLDINLGSYQVPDWQPVRRISAWAPTFAPITGDIATYDDRGAPNEAVTTRAFSASFTVQGNRSLTTGEYLPELKKILEAARGTLAAATVDVRWYHKPDVGEPNETDAGRALCRVEATRQNTGNADAEVHSVTLTGQGRFTPIENPFTGWSTTPPTTP